MSARKDELRRQFGTVWRMASSGFDTLREVVVRSSQAGRLRVDLALAARERTQLLERLGAQVAAHLDAGTVELPEDVRATWQELRDLESRIAADDGRVHDNAYGAPRGYEPEAGNFEDELDASDGDDVDDLDEHADVTVKGGRR